MTPEYRDVAGAPYVRGRIVQPGEEVIGYASGQAYLVKCDLAGKYTVTPVSADIARAYEDDAKRADLAARIAKIRIF